MTTITIRCVAGWAVLAVLSTGSIAHGKVLALESHSLPRTGRAARMVATVVNALGSDVLSGEALVKKLAQVYGRLPRTLSPERRAKLLVNLKLGDDASHIGEWDKAIKLLLPVKQGLARSVLSISRSNELFTALQRARLLLANCYVRSKRPKQARYMMAELLRAQPDISLSLAQHTPILVRLFVRVKADLDRQSPASLKVTSYPPGAVVFLGGRYVGLSPVMIAKIYPGKYDLLVMKDNRPSRIQRITVRGSHQVRVDLTLHREIASERFAGLLIKEGPGRDTLEMRFAMDIATRVGASKIVLVGRRRIKGREVLVGKVVSVSGRAAPITAYVYVGRPGPPASTLRSLGQFLSGAGAPGPGVVVSSLHVGPDKATDRSTARLSRQRQLMIAGWSIIGIGLAATAAGGLLVGIHDRLKVPGSPSEAHERLQTDTEGYATLGAGLCSVAIGVFLLVISRYTRGERRANVKPRVWLSPTTGGSVVLVGGRF